MLIYLTKWCYRLLSTLASIIIHGSLFPTRLIHHSQVDPLHSTIYSLVALFFQGAQACLIFGIWYIP